MDYTQEEYDRAVSDAKAVLMDALMNDPRFTKIVSERSLIEILSPIANISEAHDYACGTMLKRIRDNVPNEETLAKQNNDFTRLLELEEIHEREGTLPPREQRSTRWGWIEEEDDG